jgi:hypothetical protein
MGFSFVDHVELLQHFLAKRREIVDEIDRRLLNLKAKAIRQHTSRESWVHVLKGCYFQLPTLSITASKLTGALESARLADGFEPAASDGYARDLDPVDLILRAHHYWDQSRWPGRSGRILYAQSIYTVFMMRQLEHLSMRIWDEGNNAAPDRLQQVQHLLDLLNTGGAPPRVRDARWLIQSAQSSLTKHVKPYFTIAERVAGSFTDRDRLEVHKAGAILAGGHLRSQLRHRSWQTGWTVDDPQLLAITRLSNSMDMALLVGDLIPLLDAYSDACGRQDNHERRVLADAILQGLSADPELLLTRLDLLGLSTFIEDLFIDRSDTGEARLAPMGAAHLDRVQQYCTLIGRNAESLSQDALLLDPSQKAYSPLGIVYGFCGDIPSNMVLNTLRSSSSTDLSLEDVFISGERLEEKSTQAQEWQRLPKGEGERNPFEHSTEWAAQMFARLMTGLLARAAHPTLLNATSTPSARLYVVPCGVALQSLGDNAGPSGSVFAQEHCLTSDSVLARASGATVLSRNRLAADRAEGRFLASAIVDGQWFAVGKAVLTTSISRGHDALIRDVPTAVVEALRVVCPELVVVVPHSST